MSKSSPFSFLYFVVAMIKSPVSDRSASNTNLLMSALGYSFLNLNLSRLVAKFEVLLCLFVVTSKVAP